MTTGVRGQESGVRGLTLLELMVALSVLGCAFLALFDVMHLLGSGIQNQKVSSDVLTRTQGTLYDIVAELRQATAFSPNFYIEQSATQPPRITFDLVDSVDSKGNIIWGNKITYRLVKASSQQIAEFAYLNIVPGQILRDESSGTGPVTTSVIEELVPYQFVDSGVTKWGFSVSRDGSALALSISRFGTTDARGADAASAMQISTTSGVYFLRNPQVVITLQ